MAAGDASKNWFTEVVNQLKESWHYPCDWNDIISLCETLTSTRDTVRARLEIKAPNIKCCQCGETHSMSLAPISVRSALFALKKENVISYDDFVSIDKSWLSFQRKHKLTATGKKKQAKA